MTSKNEQIKENFDKLVNLGQNLFKIAQIQASPDDVIDALDGWTNEMGELKAALGGDQGTDSMAEQTPAPPGQKQEPAEKGATLQSDSAEEGREKVNEQNSSQKGLQSKTFSMDDINFYHTKAAALENENKALKARVTELESYAAETQKEQLAEEYSDLFKPHERRAKYDEVINSEEPLSVWETRIDAISEVLGTTVKSAKNESFWIPQKNAKLTQTRLKHL